jgi:hypothetical protein
MEDSPLINISEVNAATYPVVEALLLSFINRKLAILAPPLVAIIMTFYHHEIARALQQFTCFTE